ncbi:EF-P lysine aminoacylase EpmA [Desulfatirhabdium butyrativorans]|uniref:EF-P lysine aminoacylase EpmA n=1 Tax=Desulfatirhabdium butyrativorans TaxID=340467 RepID=UPI0004064F65|nr:EF-P lysine aminoacylase EpmA [Desulfatirhabdium butyrativorans]
MPSAFRQTTIRPWLDIRCRMIRAIRHFFEEAGYLEMETPIRIPAPAPETHIDCFASESWFLHASPELCMKRMLAAGYERIFQICRVLRKGERGARHLPEFTLLEWYTAGQDYRHMMAQCEALILSVAETLFAGASLNYQGRVIDLSPPWDRLTVGEAFVRHTPVTMEAALAEGRFDEWMGFSIEPNLGWERPVFLCDYPAACGSLARKSPSNPDVVERFELYIAGVELCNAFSELCDPAEQRRRFLEEQAARLRLGKTVYPMPESFLNALSAMPPATGNALGIDRLAMLLADRTTIDDVSAFVPEEA